MANKTREERRWPTFLIAGLILAGMVAYFTYALRDPATLRHYVTFDHKLAGGR